jgi:predicted transcriptional regulator
MRQIQVYDMTQPPKETESFRLPDDLVEQVAQLADHLGESPRDIVIAAVEHFARIPEERRKAVLKAASIRRRGG